MENLGKLDRWVRGIVGLVMLLVFFQALEYRVVGLAGTLLMITSVLAYCPVYGFLAMLRGKELERF